MQIITKAQDKYQEIKPLDIKLKKPVKAPHELSATVQLLKDEGLVKGRYGFGYWLALVKKSKTSYTEMIGILKSLEGMDKKYPKGAVLTNKLKQ